MNALGALTFRGLCACACACACGIVCSICVLVRVLCCACGMSRIPSLASLAHMGSRAWTRPRSSNASPSKSSTTHSPSDTVSHPAHYRALSIGYGKSSRSLPRTPPHLPRSLPHSPRRYTKEQNPDRLSTAGIAYPSAFDANNPTSELSVAIAAAYGTCERSGTCSTTTSGCSDYTCTCSNGASGCNDAGQYNCAWISGSCDGIFHYATPGCGDGCLTSEGNYLRRSSHVESS